MNPRTHRIDPMAPEASARYGTPGQRGIALIVGLVILAVLSMIGVAAFSISTQEERMAGNSRDRMRAFEAAEAALRVCEDYIVATGPVFNATGGPGGMYTAPADSTTPWNAETIDWTVPANVHTVTIANPEWSSQPACIGELFSVQRGPPPPPGTPINLTQIVHITAQGYGLNPRTVVKLESYFAL
jgi:type IV pilus assembly protein PilX